MFNKFSSAVSGVGTVVSKGVSGAVHGVLQATSDEITKSYEMPKDCTSSGGHELMWRIFPGISKKTNVEVSIFIFFKDDIKKMSKDDQEKILGILRNDMKTLRILRHPRVLKVEEVFEENKKTIAFVTEKIVCSLSNACKNFTNVTNVLPEVLEIGLSEFEVACGLMHIGEAIGFLHREGRRVHLGLGPHSVFITPSGEWKLGGFGFSRVVETGHLTLSEYYAFSPNPGQERPKYRTEPPLEYCAPEVTMEPRKFNAAADMFTLGLLVYELFSPPESDGRRKPILNVTDSNPVNHHYQVESLNTNNFPICVPVNLHNTIRSLLCLRPEQRIEAAAFLASPFFDSGPIKTIRNLESLVEMDPSGQAKFLTDLPNLLEGFSPRALRDMIIPGLQAVARNIQVAPFVIPPLLKVVEMVDKISFTRLVAPMMIPLLAMKEPVQCMLMFATKLEIIIPKAEDGFIRDHVVPMLCRALDSTVPEILDTVLNKIADQANLFEYRILKQVILPRVLKLILQPPQMSVRVNALMWMAKSYHVFDKDLLTESVLPALTQVLQVDKSPAVCMCILGCYDNLGKHLGPEFIAKSIIPAVSPLLWERSLNGSQFDMVCTRMQEMLRTVIVEREKLFMSENSVKTIASGMDKSAGITEVVRAAESKSREKSGIAAATTLLQETSNHINTPSLNQDSKSRSSNSRDEDPFYLGRKNRTESRERNSDTSGKPLKPSADGDHDESYASRRRARKGNTKKNKSAENTQGEDLLGMTHGTSNSQSCSSTSDMFSGMNIGGQQQSSCQSMGGEMGQQTGHPNTQSVAMQPTITSMRNNFSPNNNNFGMRMTQANMMSQAQHQHFTGMNPGAGNPSYVQQGTMAFQQQPISHQVMFRNQPQISYGNSGPQQGQSSDKFSAFDHL